MQGFGLSAGERFKLLLAVAGLLCTSYDSSVTTSPQDISPVSPVELSGDVSRERMEQPIRPSAKRRLRSEPQILAPLPTDQSIALPRISQPTTPAIDRAWYSTWQLRVQKVLPILRGDRYYSVQDYLQDFDRVLLYWELESPRPEGQGYLAQPLGYLKIRGHIPLQLLWQPPDSGNNPGYPGECAREFMRLSQEGAFCAQALNTAYHSGLYLRWAGPQAVPNVGSKTGEAGKPQRGSYLQVGSIRVRDESPWQTLSASAPFATGKAAPAALPRSGRPALPGQNFATTKYRPEVGLGRNWGLSWDGPHLQVLLLHQRDGTAEQLSSGLALRFDHIAAVPNIRPRTKACGECITVPDRGIHSGKNIYRLRAATLWSQNLSADSHRQNGDWYFSHSPQVGSTTLYDAGTAERWAELLRYDRAVKQIYLQAGWKRLFPKQAGPDLKPRLPARTAFLHLGSELAFSVSPLDYWGGLQKFYTRFYLPFQARQVLLQDLPTKQFALRTKRFAIGNEFLLSAADAHWVDAGRKLARSALSRRFGKRLYAQNQLSLHWRNKTNVPSPHLDAPAHSINYNTSGGLRSQEQVLRFRSGLHSIRLFQPTQGNYWNLGIRYYRLWSRHRSPSATAPDTTWYFILDAELQQMVPRSADIQVKQSSFPAPLWRRELEWRLGWQQRPPTRKPDQPESVPEQKSGGTGRGGTRFRWGWQSSLGLEEAHLPAGAAGPLGELWFSGHWDNWENLRGNWRLGFFVQVWQYSKFRHGNTAERMGWWKVFQLQLDLGIRLNFEQSGRFGRLSRLSFRAKLQGRLRLSRNWQFVLALRLDEWSLRYGWDSSAVLHLQQAIGQLANKLSLELSLRYELRSRSVAKNTDPADSAVPNYANAAAAEDDVDSSDSLRELKELEEAFGPSPED